MMTGSRKLGRNILMALIMMLFPYTYTNAAGIGTWRNYLSYHDVTQIEKANNNMLYVLASNGLYSYNTNDHSLQTFDKTNVLSDCEILFIKWNTSAKRLLIVYSNGNIDIMDNSANVINISDYYTKSMTEDKTVNDIYMYGKYAMMATGFGIVQINISDCEISNTYNLGFNVNYCYVQNNTLYAASKTKGIYKCPMTDNLLDPNNWKWHSAYVAKQTEENNELKELVSALLPGGPKNNNFGDMKFSNGKLYTCGGNINDRTPGCIQVWDGNEWQIYQDDDIQDITGLPYIDLVSIAVDPTNNRHVAVSGRMGVYEFMDGKFHKHHTEGNSPLVHAGTVKDSDPNKLLYIMAQAVNFDNSGNLWTLNSISTNNIILKLSNDYEWTTWKPQSLMYNNNYGLENLTDIMFDSRGLMWFVNDFYRIPSVHCFQPSTGGINSIKSFVNQDGTSLTITQVRCVAEDKNGDIWIGTNIGPLLLSQNSISEENPIFTQVKVPRNDGTNYADYLLSGVDISCMAVDGGNRKWFGTYNNGVYLISDDNIEQVQHFTAENSNLLSNNILSMAINDVSGEVFFGTDKGLCSYMSDATAAAGEMEKDNVYAYPNPVKPDYTGLITVVGLSMNADVKITTSSGALVAQGKSNGGTFTWDGNDASGKRVASGVYMVMTAKEDGSKGCVCKIAIVN